MGLGISFIAFVYLLSYVMSLYDDRPALKFWNPKRLEELKKLDLIEEERLEKERQEQEKEQAMIRLRQGYFYVPDKTKAWTEDFLKKLDVKPVAENPSEQ